MQKGGWIIGKNDEGMTVQHRLSKYHKLQHAKF